MRKAVLFAALATVFFGLSWIAPCNGLAQTPIKLKYSNFFPPQHAFTVLGARVLR